MTGGAMTLYGVLVRLVLSVATPSEVARAAASVPASSRPTSEFGAARSGDHEPAMAPVRPNDPTEQLYEVFKLRRGFYLSSQVGLFAVFGGATRFVSSVQPYVGIDAGYDFSSWISAQVHVGRGFAENAARTSNESDRVRDFAFTNILFGPVVRLRIAERLAIETKAHAGIALFDTPPLDAVVDGRQLSPAEAEVGGGVALQYVTLLKDFTVGIDITFNYILVAAIPSAAISPTVRYTF